jgi:NADPH:quinone reductase-like Zn-dependent oxidoreductase
MLRAMALHRTKAVVDHVFPMAEAREAYEHLIAGRHFGKVCIAIP